MEEEEKEKGLPSPVLEAKGDADSSFLSSIGLHRFLLSCTDYLLDVGAFIVGVLFEQLIVRLIGLNIIRTLFEQFWDCSNKGHNKKLLSKMSNI
jgi:hypothetical protein